MKLLIIGIDGLGDESLASFNLKRLQDLIASGQQKNPKSDNIVSRGWADIYSGKDAYESGAFFQIPQFNNNKIQPSQKTGADIVGKHIGEDSLLWSRLSEMGFNVGLYGLPTVTTAQKSCEFSFPATGAGSFANSTNGDGVYPIDLLKLADFSSANHGLRVGLGGFLPKSAEDLARWIRDHLAQNFFTLRHVLRKKNVNALVLGTRFVTLFYKFRHILIDESKNTENIALRETLLEAAEVFDFELSRLIQDLAPEHIFVISDHGLGELKYHINLNELLKGVGSIDYTRGSLAVIRRVARWGKDRMTGRRGVYFPSYDLEHSKAFSIGYTDVIYVNDARFTGPWMTNDQRFESATKLSEMLAQHVYADNLEQFVKFEPLFHSGWTKPLSNGATPIALPDIRCFLAEGCVNLGRTNRKIVEKNNPYFAKDMYEKGFFAEHSGCKTNDTIAAYIGPSKQPFHAEHLTDLYGEILRVAQEAL